jgi:hypothetical protein
VTYPVTYQPDLVSNHGVTGFHQALYGACPYCECRLAWQRAQNGDKEAAHVAECCGRRFRMVPYTVQVEIVEPKSSSKERK